MSKKQKLLVCVVLLMLAFFLCWSWSSELEVMTSSSPADSSTLAKAFVNAAVDVLNRVLSPLALLIGIPALVILFRFLKAPAEPQPSPVNSEPPSDKPVDPMVARAGAMWAIESEKLQYPARAAIGLELFKSANETGFAAIKASLFVNGGSAVAVLALIGHLASVAGTAVSIESFAMPLAIFVAGVWCSAVAYGVTYLAARSGQSAAREELSDEEREQKKSMVRVINGFAIALVVGSLLLFTFGCVTGYRAILDLSSKTSPIEECSDCV